MHGSYRSYILALVGWLVLAAAAPNHGDLPKQAAQPQQNQSGDQVSQAANTVATAINNTVGSPDHDRRCNQGQDDRNSDLCAQWKAADAARESADWAQRGFWLGLAGTALLLWTLRVTARGTKAAVEAVEAQIISDRPLMQVKDLIARRAASQRPSKYPFCLNIHWEVENYGKTGCWLECVNINPVAGKVQPTGIIPDCDIEVNSFAAPGHGASATAPYSLIEFTKGEENLILGAKKLYVYGFTRYRDLGRRVWQTHFAFVIHTDKDGDSVSFHAIPSEEHWRDERVEMEKMPE